MSGIDDCEKVQFAASSLLYPAV